MGFHGMVNPVGQPVQRGGDSLAVNFTTGLLETPHDELQPRMSALILISHVKEGVELAREEGLPRAIIDIIPQHHGTGEIASFKHRALERGRL